MLLTALTVGGIAAAVGNAVAWRLATPAPSKTETTAALSAALPGVPVTWSGWHDDVNDVHGIQQQASFSQGGVDRAAFDAARGRLAGAGWRTADEEAPDGKAFFVADRDGMVLEWEFSPAGYYSSPPGDSIEVWAWRFTPPRVKALTVTGWLLGGVLGWWLARRMLRLRSGQRRTRILLTAKVLIGVFALSTAAALMFTAQGLLNRPVQGGQPIAVWFAYFPFLRPFGFQWG
jgi:hypothetical protein